MSCAPAGDLASDIRRYLRGEAILARPASARYQLLRLARRHKALVGGVLGVMAALAADAMVSLLYALRADATPGRPGTRPTGPDSPSPGRRWRSTPSPTLRGWEWDHLHSRLDDSTAVVQQPADSPIFFLNGPRGVRVGTAAAGSVRVTDSDGRESLRFPLGTGHLASLVAPPGGVRSVEIAGKRLGRGLGFAFSPDGRQLASCGEDKLARVWDASTGALAVEMRGHTSKVLHVAFRLDGARLLTASADGTVRQWDVTTGREVEPPYERHIGEVRVATFSPDGRLIASGGFRPGRSYGRRRADPTWPCCAATTAT